MDGRPVVLTRAQVLREGARRSQGIVSSYDRWDIAVLDRGRRHPALCGDRQCLRRLACDRRVDPDDRRRRRIGDICLLSSRLESPAQVGGEPRELAWRIKIDDCLAMTGDEEA